MDWKVIKLNNLVDVSSIQSFPPKERGTIKYLQTGEIIHEKEETQVNGSLSRYNFPEYKELFYYVKKCLEDNLNDKLYPTYYFDRFYFKGQDLKRHVDRDACEISVSLHISNNLDYDWPIYFELEEEKIECICNPGDAVLYKGREITHWRDPMKGNSRSYYHQIFLHYVRANGHFLQNAYDRI